MQGFTKKLTFDTKIRTWLASAVAMSSLSIYPANACATIVGGDYPEVWSRTGPGIVLFSQKADNKFALPDGKADVLIAHWSSARRSEKRSAFRRMQQADFRLFIRRATDTNFLYA